MLPVLVALETAAAKALLQSLVLVVHLDAMEMCVEPLWTARSMVSCLVSGCSFATGSCPIPKLRNLTTLNLFSTNLLMILTIIYLSTTSSTTMATHRLLEYIISSHR
ncbi:hypothetical protein PF005_g6530 [Phytophthora fragariae]|uniref:Uncharacterized protein n=1 Tax=Phytophthora fragariae TaxID=53985 RepID=A0A6A4E3X7_9STRA|nr:hypothetical protein PF003_g27914 [Phytophthora fragariae]KAE8944335.1 hypothetical protein PF009_g5984 [Phytophthora fragariae]KAE9124947.1 hypothetical protein PF010_g5810 [Phytophthora fragariae]KAE9127294.1 hypothetical protein PF007_g5657 [Phytophthora fragariae]KAE9149634.1 hypothetical protein PF006_g5901 [Phytophthora fragariae]